VSASDLRNDHLYSDAWLKAAQQAGHWRSSAADALLHPILRRPNLTVLSSTTVSRMML
jgi:choline dehydrogenase-like flavoprotein